MRDTSVLMLTANSWLRMGGFAGFRSIKTCCTGKICDYEFAIGLRGKEGNPAGGNGAGSGAFSLGGLAWC